MESDIVQKVPSSIPVSVILCQDYVGNADAKTNINLAEMKKTYENTNHSIHLIPIGRIRDFTATL